MISPPQGSWLRSVRERLEFRTLALIVAAGACLWAFLEISDDVSENDTASLDRTLLLALRTPGHPADPIGSRTFEEAMRDVTALGGFTFLTLLVTLTVLALLFYRERRQAIVLAATVIAAQLSADLLKGIYARPRPDLVPHGSYVYSHSFPSGHSMLSAVVFLTMAAILSSLQERRSARVFILAVAVLLTVAVGISRVYLGVHWPSDVVAGWTLGAAWAFAGRLALSVWRSRSEAAER
ncbi:phosphatase PAP2 family protein [Phenylobacterium sp.]|uniref:phosphatase PAP2 family protein n=1 Tax=Phenylobacterium sp. TaxID=1871053 RepID=UPI0027328C18|nr:phosphatase PAP2 family protein [Phenylobacterium sp.]MDP3659654.1 phosphatase PAP2 family protein [Phenylobacterium sp.]